MVLTFQHRLIERMYILGQALGEALDIQTQTRGSCLRGSEKQLGRQTELEYVAMRTRNMRNVQIMWERRAENEACKAVCEIATIHMSISHTRKLRYTELGLQLWVAEPGFKCGSVRLRSSGYPLCHPAWGPLPIPLFPFHCATLVTPPRAQSGWSMSVCRMNKGSVQPHRAVGKVHWDKYQVIWGHSVVWQVRI